MRTLSLALTLLFGPFVASAQEPLWQELSDVRFAAESHVQAQSPPGTTAKAAELDARLRLARCSEPLTSFATTGGATITVGVQCRQPAWTVYVPVRAQLRARVVVLRQPLQRGQVLTVADVLLEEREIDRNQGYFPEVSAVLGLALRRPLAPGAVLSPEALVPQTLVRRGELVTLLGRSGPMEVRVQGKALSDGTAGQAVQVQNTSSGRVVGGVVKASGLVEVQL